MSSSSIAFGRCASAACLATLILVGPTLADERERLLTSAEQLAKNIDRATPDLVILDVRTQDEYAAKHIPGARWVDTNAWRSKTFEATGLTDQAYWTDELGKLGLTNKQTIVIAGSGLPEAARYWWLLRYLGLPNAQLLDGGYAAWTSAQLPQTSEQTAITATQPKVEFQTSMLASLDDVMPQGIDRSGCKIVDTRSEAEFTGSRGVGTRTGHIPNAVHLEWQEFVGPDGKFLSAAAIEKKMAAAKLSLEDPLVAHCQTGGRSSVAVFAMELVGAKHVKNYYRGWSEYSEALTAPVEK